VKPDATTAARDPDAESPVRFSVFIPVWNDTVWLPGAIESVLAQDYPHWELIVGDNASDADVAGLVAAYDDARIRYHRFASHVPIDENFNRTALLAESAWVQLLCADDRLRQGCLSRLSEAIRSASAAIAAQGSGADRRLALALTACRRVYPNGEPADRVWYGSKRKLPVRAGIYDSQGWFDALMQDGQPPWNAGSIAVSRHVIEESGGFFRPEVGLSCDVEMVLRAGAYGDVVYIDEPLLDFTVRSDADNAIRLWANRAKGSKQTPSGAAILAALRVHEHRRVVTPAERRMASAAVARSHLQRAAQHRVLADGLGRPGAIRDVVRAMRHSPSTVLAPYHLGYAVAAILLPRPLLRTFQQWLAARHPG
jgi:glycosyltransferase involved in cell wall biosynthesis